MMSRLFLITTLSFFFLLPLPLAGAEVFHLKTKITRINADSNYFYVDHPHPQTGELEEIKIDVPRSAHFDGFDSLADLKAGDEITLDADYNEYTHDWTARSIGPYLAE